MNKWRVIALEKEHDSYLKMATEEAIINSVRKKDSPPTLRFYSWNKPAVSLGYFQKANTELNLDKCKEDNIEIFRRLTGGGAVYKSSLYEINYSFIIREDDPLISKNVEESYQTFSKAIIEGFKSLGIILIFKPINDILFNGKKVSGNAQTRIDNVVLHHGTILLRPEIEKMFKYLKVDSKKFIEKKASSPKDLVTGIYDYSFIPINQIIDAIIKGFIIVFETNFKYSTLSETEKKNAQELYSKYSDNNFIFYR